jgi:hypothetical protein
MAKVGTIEHELDKVARMIISANAINSFENPCNINKLSSFIRSFFQYNMTEYHYNMVEDLYPDTFTFYKNNACFYINVDNIPDDLM